MESVAQDYKTAHDKRAYTEIGVELVAQSPYQTRRSIDAGELVESIRAFGVLNPVTVRKRGVGLFDGKTTYEMIAGHRRLAAARILGMEFIPAIVIACDDRTAAEMCVAENMQRVNLSPLEEAEGVRALLDTGHTAQDIADRLGKSRQWVARRANLLNLCEKVRERLENPDDELSLAPVAGLEVIAGFPPEMQVKILGRSSSFTLGGINQAAARLMRGLDDAPFLTEGCVGCQKRTGCQPDLFDAEDGEGLGRCLDDKCFNEKARAHIAASIAKVQTENPRVPVYSDDWALANEHSDDGVKFLHYGQITKKNEKGAVKAVCVGNTGKTRTVYVRGPHAGDDGGGDGKPRQPTAEQKRMAAYCREVTEKLSGEDFNPFRDTLPNKEILSVISVVGTLSRTYARAES